MNRPSSGKLIAVGLTCLLVAEASRPLRARVATRRSRVPRNLLLALGSAAVVRGIEEPLARGLSQRVNRRRQGLLPALGLRPWVEVAAGFLLLDYTLYHWHRWNHKVPLLWRFHAPHHVDPDLDLSTGVAFHPLEMLLSVPFRLAQIRLLGIRPAALALWKGVLLPAVLFHHSNLRLPRRIERLLSRLFVTPRMHGIHHSQREDERDSNWSSLLSLWDRLHRTYRFDVPQAAIQIGLPEDAMRFGKLQRRGDRQRSPRGGSPA